MNGIGEAMRFSKDERRLVVATTNAHKIREIRALLEGVAIELVTLAEWPAVRAPEETGRTFEENARQKATYYARATRELVVAEDSGLEIDALHGAPGVESARYGGIGTTYPQKFALIYDALARSSGHTPRTARFICALALVQGQDILFEARGTVEGEIAPAPKGSGGFGYDPLFLYPHYGRTLGEATAAEKSAVSHRGQAFRRLRDFLLEHPALGTPHPAPGTRHPAPSTRRAAAGGDPKVARPGKLAGEDGPAG